MYISLEIKKKKKNPKSRQEENGPKADKNEKEDRSNRIRQNHKRADRKVESNDSPKIPDRGEASEMPGLPFEHC